MKTGQIILPTSQPLGPGDYDLYTSDGVNPDDNYKITCFIPDDFGLDGRILDPSILRNMRGAGEPSWEHDFPPGSDMLREILEGPFPIERFEMELSARLRVGNETRT
ncbi:hypothetical protein DTO027B5_5791 [Paecilomyces variotii]|nr:hypothetical protein DTO169C6_6688 [Paecilomyces variotii]KAJ9253047.1 hypothetical protein DTO207G8_4348 [Paecilomyces variotii]KAJ9288405.1 hypothetical protein DTO021C3_3924 [Paecilomyces variotii]KAJ9324165.1 hypothetical protein DTO027B3_4720 [Paecilomyces variotii]KAJ9332497.1 hypothetical protein DTO027B5_5791 [Paecilomyces variotii]